MGKMKDSACVESCLFFDCQVRVWFKRELDGQLKGKCRQAGIICRMLGIG